MPVVSLVELPSHGCSLYASSRNQTLYGRMMAFWSSYYCTKCWDFGESESGIFRVGIHGTLTPCSQGTVSGFCQPMRMAWVLQSCLPSSFSSPSPPKQKNPPKIMRTPGCERGPAIHEDWPANSDQDGSNSLDVAAAEAACSANQSPALRRGGYLARSVLVCEHARCTAREGKRLSAKSHRQQLLHTFTQQAQIPKPIPKCSTQSFAIGSVASLNAQGIRISAIAGLQSLLSDEKGCSGGHAPASPHLVHYLGVKPPLFATSTSPNSLSACTFSTSTISISNSLVLFYLRIQVLGSALSGLLHRLVFFTLPAA
ncbi:predicted protein [Uncinocarpus reesii 1704]|uniref:Uncharacterized protein n=1 Tax=Uncinocarpus reesii (strain UAMH 1704) TaxID=336963 RepID=C4JUJ0_UNCRE|nr:uncharacterized protein UREG_04793 [Uncinocarpus reesii 1704]EEP79951.1 predicted protein [Uncinocarpus reesii 1704]